MAVRALQLNAYSAAIDALRASSNPNHQKTINLLNHLRNVFKISEVRHSAEVRRACGDERLCSLTESASSSSAWLRRCRRPVPAQNEPIGIRSRKRQQLADDLVKSVITAKSESELPLFHLSLEDEKLSIASEENSEKTPSRRNSIDKETIIHLPRGTIIKIGEEKQEASKPGRKRKGDLIIKEVIQPQKSEPATSKRSRQGRPIRKPSRFHQSPDKKIIGLAVRYARTRTCVSEKLRKLDEVKKPEVIKKESTSQLPKPALPDPVQASTPAAIKKEPPTQSITSTKTVVPEFDQNKNKTLIKTNNNAPPPLTLPPAPCELKPKTTVEVKQHNGTNVQNNSIPSQSVIVTTTATPAVIQRKVTDVKQTNVPQIAAVPQTMPPVSVTSKSVLYSKQPGIILHNVVTPTVQIVQNTIGQNPKSPSHFSRFGMADILNEPSGGRPGTTDVTPAGNHARSGTPNISNKSAAQVTPAPVRSSIESPRGSTSSFEHQHLQQQAVYNQQKTEHLQRQILKQPGAGQTHFIGGSGHRGVLRKAPETVLERAGTPAPHLQATQNRTNPAQQRRLIHNPVVSTSHLYAQTPLLMNQSSLIIDPNQFHNSRTQIRPSYLRVENQLTLPGNIGSLRQPQLLLQPQLYLHPQLGNGTAPHTLNGYTTDPRTNNNR